MTKMTKISDVDDSDKICKNVMKTKQRL